MLLSAGLVLLAGRPKPNHAPWTAVIPDGEPFTSAGGPSAMWSNTEDIDGDSVAIRFAWGDGDTSDWSPYFPERGWTSMTHTWTSAGTYTVTAQAKDERGATSGWSSGRTVQVIRGWAKTFGSPNFEFGKSVQQTQDGGYIIAAKIYSLGTGSGVIWLVKTDADGDTVWTRTFSGVGKAWCNSVRQTADGGYIIVGGTGLDGANSYDVFLAKTDANGGTSWTRTYGGMSGDGANGMSTIQQTMDGGYVIVTSTSARGARSDDIWMLKTDVSGDTIWTRTYGGQSLDESRSVQLTQDGGYVIVGNTMSFGAGSTDIWLLKTDASGDTMWTRTFGGSGTDHGYSVQQTQDGGYIITGSTNSGSIDAWGLWLIKTDANGDAVWTRSFGGMESKGHSVQQTLDGGYVITGGSSNALLIKTDANGEGLWTRTFGWEGVDVGNSVCQTMDGGYTVAGTTDSYGAGREDVWLIRVESDGEVSKAPAASDTGAPAPDARGRSRYGLGLTVSVIGLDQAMPCHMSNLRP